MPPLRVLVVDDSLTVRSHIVQVLGRAGIEVVGEAADGKAAIEACLRLKPDVITMDMMLPVMTGLGATEYIMAYQPTPILVVSASTNRGELFKTYDALAAGALDVLEKPELTGNLEEWEQKLIEQVKRAAQIKVISHPRGRLGRMGQGSAWQLKAPSSRMTIALGASTGGPAAVLKLLSALDQKFPCGILLVIHIAESFGSAMALWLDSQVALTVREAQDGDPFPPPAGHVLMAPSGRHLLLRGGSLRLMESEARHSCRPSVDVLFESLAAESSSPILGCLLTGMGKDGAQGLLALRRAGHKTMAQDEESSVVWGMPGEAVKLGAAEKVLSLQSIGQTLSILTDPK